MHDDHKRAGLSTFCTCLLLFAAALAGGCGKKQPTHPLADTVTQVATLDALAAGDVGGKRTLAEMLRCGDAGVGYFGNLEAALVVLDGKPYRIGPDGAVSPAATSNQVAFATVTFFAYDHAYDVGEMPRTVFEKTMDWKRSDTGLVYAIEVIGRFASVELRTADQPDAVALTDLAGTMIGFWFPPALHGTGRPGYELFFIDKERKRGGLVGDFTLAQGRIEVDAGQAFQLLLGKQAGVAQE
jgi:acetolactate decarboxylase